MAKAKAPKVTKVKQPKIPKPKAAPKFPKTTIKLKTAKAQKQIKWGQKLTHSASTTTGLVSKSRSLGKIPGTSKYANINPTKVSY